MNDVTLETDNIESVHNADNSLENIVKKLKKLEDSIREHGVRSDSRTKTTPRERIRNLIDKNEEFFELSLLAGHEMYDFPLPAGGIITGIAKVEKKICMIICNDYQTKAGTYLPITVKKHLRAQEIAFENSLPCIYIVDSGGAFLPEQLDLFADKEHFGRIFFNQARMSALGIPQISIVMGSCTAGGAYIPAMSDETIMVKNQATIFLAGPPLVKAATGEITNAEDLGGSDIHCKVSGLADYFADSEIDAINKARSIIKNIPGTDKNFNISSICDSNSQENIYDYISSDLRYNFSVRSIISILVDNGSFCEFKEQYGQTLVCGVAKIAGFQVGVIANNGVLLSESSLKGCHFVQLCNKRKIPLIFLQNIMGFMIGRKHEANGIAKHGAALVNAVATTSVPKLTVIMGGSYGAGNYAMCGRAFQPRFLWSWPNSKTAIMGGKQAAEVLAQVKNGRKPYTERWNKTEEESFKSKIKTKFDTESSAIYTSARLLDDGVIDPKDTRKFLILGLTLIYQEPITASNHGIFRM